MHDCVILFLSLFKIFSVNAELGAEDISRRHEIVTCLYYQTFINRHCNINTESVKSGLDAYSKVTESFKIVLS